MGSWHVGGESSPASLPCACRRGVPVLRPPGGPEHPLPLPSLFIPRCPQPWAKPCLELVVPVAAGSQQGGEVRSRGAGGALRQAWLLQRVSESCSHQHGPGNCLILPALPAKDGISVCRRNTVLQTSNYPGRGFASVPARAPALRWPLCPSPCGGARGGLQAGWIPAAARGSCLSNASRAGLRRGKKAAGCLGSALAEATAWQETLLILSQHSYGRAGRPQSRRDASCADTA